MDVVLYMRYSSDKQTEQSIEGQQRVCAEFCRQQGYTIVGMYIDRATSAFKDTEKRLEFNRMIKDSDKQLWQGVVVYKLDRFARNRYDSATYKAKLKKNGVRVISATENISDNPEGVILEAVLEGMAEFYSKELSQKIQRGRKESAIKGLSIGGRTPLGYKIENKRLVLDPPAAAIVKEAFDMYSSGSTLFEIMRKFNSAGFRTANGGEFKRTSLQSILTNERYLGIYRYKDMCTEGAIPAIIDKQTFDAVQKKMKENKRAPGRSKAKVDYLLAQKIFCGHCGSNMVGESGTSRNGSVYNYYTCASHKRGGSCDKKAVPKDYIEKAVVEDTLRLLTPENIEYLADLAIRQNREDIANDELIPVLKKDLADTMKKINNLLKLAETGVDSESLSNRLKELEHQKADLNRRITDAEGEYVVLEKDHIVWWLTRFTQGSVHDEEFRRRIIDLLVNSVTVWDDSDGKYRVTVLYNLTDNQTTTFTIGSADSGSDIKSIVPPKRSNPNHFFVYGTVFGFTAYH